MCSSAGGATLYRTDTLQALSGNNPALVASMLRTFLHSGERWLGTLHQGFGAGDMPALQAAAHYIRPSLALLHSYHALRLVARLEAWEGPFDGPALQPLVAGIATLLRQTIGQITTDLTQCEPLAA